MGDGNEKTARDALEEKAADNPGGLSQGEHIALALYYVGDVLGEGLIGDDELED
jgi:hypothetical protein